MKTPTKILLALAASILIAFASRTIGQSVPTAGQNVPEEVRRQLRHNVDSSFVVFRDKVQAELKLTREQEEKLEVVLPDAMQFLQKTQSLPPDERKKELKAYRPKARARLEAVITETLNDSQRARLRQIVMQREGLRNAEIWKELQITDEQQKQFVPLMQQAQKETQTLMEELHQSGKLHEIQPKVIKVREDLEDHLAALLTDSQKKQWKEMLGQPMATADLFDL
jgi:Spy/CpxP family protein refolding chaperone